MYFSELPYPVAAVAIRELGRIYINAASFDTSEHAEGFGYNSVSEAQAALIIHELAHLRRTIPSDAGNPVQSTLNEYAVKFFCFIVPGSPYAPAVDRQIPVERLGVLGSGRSFIVLPFWYRAMGDFLAWVHSIPLGNDEGPLQPRPRHPPKLKL